MSEMPTPFARLLQQWMRRQQPPMIHATELANLLGMSRKTVWQWLNGSTVPRPAALVIIAQKTGIPAEELLRTAGYDYQPEQVAPDVMDAVWHFLEDFNRSGRALTPEVREELRVVIQRAAKSPSSPPPLPPPSTCPNYTQSSGRTSMLHENPPDERT